MLSQIHLQEIGVSKTKVTAQNGNRERLYVNR
jgi:hypothetical protein